MYQANRMANSNGGAANLSTAGLAPTRHQPPVSVTGNFHQTASALCQMTDRHAHNAVQGALMSAKRSIEQGQPTLALDLSRIEEEVSVNLGRELTESLHGDSSYAQMLNQISSAAGPPSKFTQLPQNEAIFNAQSIAHPIESTEKTTTGSNRC